MALRHPFRVARRPPTGGAASPAFTLTALMVVTAVIGVVLALTIPAVNNAVGGARRTVCASNLRHVQRAFTMYLDDHDGRWFPYYQDLPEGRLWFWGLEPGGPAPHSEGMRPLDRSRARLAPYLGEGTVETCPSFPYAASYFKRKFATRSYGYGVNAYMIQDLPWAQRAGVRSVQGIRDPADLITWADAVQINTWQAPASPSNPMLEEWYYLDGLGPPNFHFRHGLLLNAAFLDGSVRSLPPQRLDPRCDGQVGYLEPHRQDRYLHTAR